MYTQHVSAILRKHNNIQTNAIAFTFAENFRTVSWEWAVIKRHLLYSNECYEKKSRFVSGKWCIKLRMKLKENVWCFIYSAFLSEMEKWRRRRRMHHFICHIWLCMILITLQTNYVYQLLFMYNKISYHRVSFRFFVERNARRWSIQRNA